MTGKIILEPKGEPVKRPDPESADLKAMAFSHAIDNAHKALSAEGFIKRGKSTLKYRPLPARAWQDKYWALHDKLHSARVALMAADATLALCTGKVPPYVEDRRAETAAIVRASLKELDP